MAFATRRAGPQTGWLPVANYRHHGWEPVGGHVGTACSEPPVWVIVRIPQNTPHLCEITSLLQQLYSTYVNRRLKQSSRYTLYGKPLSIARELHDTGLLSHVGQSHRRRSRLRAHDHSRAATLRRCPLTRGRLIGIRGSRARRKLFHKRRH